ncbi:hypothetical protein Golob_002944 [Gossypium lobatum]|uniref:Uncharacterized protein n=1 Tax=Gossypium lobatum TaxID=34289 RepID=A0A7J8N6T3_9ROSI|nr:hypothetical protein [Gossypium lobatum]
MEATVLSWQSRKISTGFS